MDVFIDPLSSSPPLFVFGAGHVGYHVARLAALVGFQVHVVDDREKFANGDRFAPPIAFTVEAIPGWIGRHPLPSDGYAVVVTRGHRDDLDTLRGLVGQPLKYLGLIGSKAKVARLYDALQAEGCAAAELARVQAPIGLDIGAITPEEIALAIVAELVAVRYGKLDPAPDANGQIVRSSKWTPSLSAAAPNT